MMRCASDVLPMAPHRRKVWVYEHRVGIAATCLLNPVFFGENAGPEDLGFFEVSLRHRYRYHIENGSVPSRYFGR